MIMIPESIRNQGELEIARPMETAGPGQINRKTPCTQGLKHVCLSLASRVSLNVMTFSYEHSKSL